MKLSYRQGCALIALADLGTPAGGGVLADRMTTTGRAWGTAAAHQAASGLVNKGLAVKGYPAGSKYVHYELTDAGRATALALRGAS